MVLKAQYKSCHELHESWTNFTNWCSNSGFLWAGAVVAIIPLYQLFLFLYMNLRLPIENMHSFTIIREVPFMLFDLGISLLVFLLSKRLNAA